MLRAERRSNFRDAALQRFGSDAQVRPAIFAALSAAAELCFAALAPPTPSDAGLTPPHPSLPFSAPTTPASAVPPGGGSGGTWQA